MKKRFMAAIGAVLMTGLMLLTASPAYAVIVMKGPYQSRSACVSESSNFARYYVITRACFDPGPRENGSSGLWYFTYNNRRPY